MRLILLLILLVFSAFFSGSETALMAIDRLRIKYLVQKKRKGAELLEDTLARPDRLLGAILVGNNLVNIAASVIATGLLISLFGDDGEWLTIVILTPVLLVFAEVVPKTYSAQQAEKVSFIVLRPIRWVMLLLTPVITVLSWATYLLTLWAGKKGEPAPIITEDEI
ncbi:MAG: transporter, partial [Desulfuromonas sp.]